jgi:hypothetical protein
VQGNISFTGRLVRAIVVRPLARRITSIRGHEVGGLHKPTELIVIVMMLLAFSRDLSREEGSHENTKVKNVVS